MKKLIFAICLTAAAGVFTFAQSNSDYKKFEVYGGYSNGQVDTGIDSGNSFRSFFDDRRSFNGFEGSAVYNFSRYFGAKADVSGTYNNTNFSFAVPIPAGGTGTVSFNTENSLQFSGRRSDQGQFIGRAVQAVCSRAYRRRARTN
jgi:hypothetical protein